MIAAESRALLLAAAALVAACASSDKPKPAPLEPLTAQIAGRQVWSARIDRVDFPLTIAVSGDVFTVAGGDGVVRALRADDGAEVWRGSAGAPLTAGVHDQVGRRAYPADTVLSIAGEARKVGDQGVAAAGQPVEQRRLADVGPADEGDDRLHARTAAGARERY